MNLRHLSLCALLSFSACGSGKGITGLLSLDSGVGLPDGGDSTGDGGFPCRGQLPVDCCGSAGQRLSSATCTAQGFTCEMGQICQCAGKPQTSVCADVCGSDSYIGPECTAQGFQCPSGLIETSSCPKGTCWGEPGDCCLDPRCENGAWVCGGGIKPNC